MANSRKAARARLALLACALMAVAACALAWPARALADDRDYEIVRVDINAAVSQDGTLTVDEWRTYDFDGHFNGVYWEIPCGKNSSNGKTVEVSVEGVEADGSSVEQGETGANNTYSVEPGSSTVRLKIYSSHNSGTATFHIRYKATGIVTRWEDTGELYWKFVSDGWDKESQNVTCTLTLPVPTGVTVSGGDNVRAWGHGPLDGSVSFNEDGTVTFKAPGVGTEEYAEMRVTFPAEWVSGTELTSGSKMSTILSEEQAWANETNARRVAARVAVGATCVAGLGLAIATAVVGALTMRKYRRLSAPQFTDKYFRDVPTDDHPAVLGALFNDGKVTNVCVSASLMRLTDLGAIKLEKVTTRKKGFFGDKLKDDFRITQIATLVEPDAANKTARLAARIDQETLDFVFDRIAGDKSANPTLYFSQIKECAEDHPSRYSSAYSDWSSSVEGQYIHRFAGTGVAGVSKGPLIALAVVDAVAAAALAVAGAMMGLSLVLVVVGFVLLAIAAVVSGACASQIKDVNAEGIEVRAKLKALRAWLCDFTHLDEAVPTDVVLWNRLLVMAVVLGVAEKVIEQLKDAMPQIFDDDDFMSTYGWYGYYYGPGYGGAPINAFAQQLEAAHEVSVAETASSDFSDGGGGGGGFSGGGGGGFGGGGGGGAF